MLRRRLNVQTDQHVLLLFQAVPAQNACLPGVFDRLKICPYDEKVGFSAPDFSVWPIRHGCKMASIALVAPSFNGRTAASGAAYRGSNPWGAANTRTFPTFLDLPRTLQEPIKL